MLGLLLLLPSHRLQHARDVRQSRRLEVQLFLRFCFFRRMLRPRLGGVLLRRFCGGLLHGSLEMFLTFLVFDLHFVADLHTIPGIEGVIQLITEAHTR